MATKNLKMTLDRVRSATDKIRSLGADRVLVGIPAENAFRRPEPGVASEPTNAMLGYIHENGSPAKNIPARPFLMPGIRDVQVAVADRLESSIRGELRGSPMDVERTLHTIGLMAQASVRKRITDGPFAPLAPRTIAKRIAKGRTGTKPLIDTGQLRNSINYVVGPAR